MMIELREYTVQVKWVQANTSLAASGSLNWKKIYQEDDPSLVPMCMAIFFLLR